MKVVHISYARIRSYSSPENWLRKINFFTGIVEAMALNAELYSIHCIDYDGVLKTNGATYQFFKCSRLEAVFPRRLHKLIRTLNPDAVIVHGLAFPWQVIQLQRSLKKNTRLYLQNHAEKPLRFHKHYLQRWADRRIDGYFFTSLALATPWIERGQISLHSKIHEVMEVSSVFHPIDRAEARNRTGIKSDLSFLWVGRLDKNKDPLTLVMAFINFVRIKKKATLHIIFQESDLLTEIRQLLDAHPVEKEQITLAGKIEHSELIYWYNSVNFIISTSHYEGSGVAVCEAMSCGCIPIVTDIASFRMMTDDGRLGLLFKPGEIHELSNRLAQSATLDIADERAKVVHYFNTHLSHRAIATQMLQVVAG